MAGRRDRRAHLHNARAQSTHPSNVTSETFPRGNNSRFESFPLFSFLFAFLVFWSLRLRRVRDCPFISRHIHFFRSRLFRFRVRFEF